MITKYTNARTIKDASIAHRIIVRSFVHINRLATCESAKRIKIHIGFSTLNVTNNKLRRRELRESRSINLYITSYAIKRQLR